MVSLAIRPRATSDHRSSPNDLRPRYPVPAGFTPFVSTNPTRDCILDISQHFLTVRRSLLPIRRGNIRDIPRLAISQHPAPPPISIPCSCTRWANVLLAMIVSVPRVVPHVQMILLQAAVAGQSRVARVLTGLLGGTDNELMSLMTNKAGVDSQIKPNEMMYQGSSRKSSIWFLWPCLV